MECRASHSTTISPELIISRYVIPMAFAVGIIGNMLNLIVLNRRRMRCKTNYFLSAMAVADLGFFLIMTLYHLPTYIKLSASPVFNEIYMHAKMPLTALANWFSTSSTWLAMAVTSERLIAISKPLHANIWLKKKRIVLIIVSIFILSLPVYAYTFIWHTPTKITREVCNESRTLWTLREINQTEQPSMYAYVHMSLRVVPHISVTIPLFVLIFLNTWLLCSLYKSKRRSSQLTLGLQKQRKPELRIAFMVAVTVASFLLFQTPSGVVYIWDAINGSRNRPNWFYKATYASNKLVILGKTLNFILYCASCKSFRQQLILLFKKGKTARSDTYKRQTLNYKPLTVAVDQTRTKE